jgi:hypothetical protein
VGAIDSRTGEKDAIEDDKMHKSKKIRLIKSFGYMPQINKKWEFIKTKNK